jgi:hypothetical protein
MLLVERMTENGVKIHVGRMTLNVVRRLMTHERVYTMKAMLLLETMLMAF